MSELKPEDDDESIPIVIDISLREQIRKERIVAIVFVLLILGLSYIIYLNRF